MTKYANTPAGRAAAAADMAATGTTMGRRPTGPKGPMVRPGFPSGPRPKGYGPNDGGPRPMGPRTPGPKGPMVRPGVPSGPSRPIRPRGYGSNDGGPRPMGPRTPVAKPLPPRPSAAEGKPAFSPNVSYSQPPGATKPTPRTQDFAGLSSLESGTLAGLSSLEKATGQSMADFRKRQAAQNAAIIGNSTGSTPVAEQPFRRRGSDVPYDDTPGVTSTPSDPGRTKYPLDSNGNYIIPTGSVLGGSLGLKKGGAVKSKAMRGGGLARKGVGMALAKGGLARRAGGCAKRGVGRGKIT